MVVAVVIVEAIYLYKFWSIELLHGKNVISHQIPKTT
jgi:hypothetical protein